MESYCYIGILIGIFAAGFIVGLISFLMRLSGKHSEEERRREFDEILGRKSDITPDGRVNPYGGYPDD